MVAKNFKFNDNREAMNAMLAKPDGLLALVDDHSRARDTMNQLNGTTTAISSILIKSI